MNSTRRPRFNTAHTLTFLLAIAFALGAIPVFAQAAPERMPDKDVKRLIDQVDEARDKFEGNLDNQLKNSKFKGPNGETNVAVVLQDYQDNTKKLQSRFNEEYAAGPEVATVLRQGAAIHTFMQGTSSVGKGRKEWDLQAASLTHLAAAYGTTFPMMDGATAQRMNDKETAAAAAAVATAADRFKNDLDNVKTLPKPDKDAAKKDVEALIKQAEAVKDHTSDGKASTAEVQRLVEQAARVQTFVGAHEMPTTNWQLVQASLAKVQRAFRLTK